MTQITTNGVQIKLDYDQLRAAGVKNGIDISISFAGSSHWLRSSSGRFVDTFASAFKAQLLELQSGMFDNVGAVPQIRIEFTEDLEPGLTLDDVKGNLTAYLHEYREDGTTEISGLINTVTQGVTEGDQNS